MNHLLSPPLFRFVPSLLKTQYLTIKTSDSRHNYLLHLLQWKKHRHCKSIGFLPSCTHFKWMKSPYFVVPTPSKVSATGFSAKQIVSISPFILIKCAALNFSLSFLFSDLWTWLAHTLNHLTQQAASQRVSTLSWENKPGLKKKKKSVPQIQVNVWMHFQPSLNPQSSASPFCTLGHSNKRDCNLMKAQGSRENDNN